ncbi:DUF4174 domain-containing protein [Rubrobacter tropicus]|uniref:DUF4174 domain-containing protein n=1 Tax=Rubrobacter tropicus TaxID=2653851 RepID=UPI001D19498C|nr:DUF4174 domain-containing protein [Rubrobacter tropicus]
MTPDPASYRGKNRLFLIFTPSGTDEEYVRQRDLLQDRQAEFEDRDLITQTFFDDTTGADAARAQFGIEGGSFAVVLVGKDGGEKFRASEPVGPRDLFDRIDAMPMRRREMRQGKIR